MENSNSEYVSFKIFDTFSHKVVQTWFVCYATLHIKLFGSIYYCSEMVRIENNSHMLEIDLIKQRAGSGSGRAEC